MKKRNNIEIKTRSQNRIFDYLLSRITTKINLHIQANVYREISKVIFYETKEKLKLNLYNMQDEE